jgi:hypothetical protein
MVVCSSRLTVCVKKAAARITKYKPISHLGIRTDLLTTNGALPVIIKLILDKPQDKTIVPLSANTLRDINQLNISHLDFPTALSPSNTSLNDRALALPERGAAMVYNGSG